MSWGNLSLLTRFTLIGLTLTIAIGWLLGEALGRQLERSALEQEANSAADTVTLLLDPFLRPDDFAAPPSAERYWAIDRRIRDSVLQSHIVRVKIWNSSGMVIYSDDPSAVGQRHPLERGLNEALGGQIATEISDLSKPENVTERAGFTRLMEVYVPISLGGQSVVGAYELYHDMAILEPGIAAMQRFLWISLTLGLGLLYLALYGVVRRASQQLRRQSEELAEAEARRAIDRLQTDFVGFVSHELRTPLTALVGFSELLLADEADEAERRDWTQKLHGGAERLTRLVEELLDVSRIQEGRFELKLEPIEVRPMIEETLAPFELQAAGHHLDQRYREPLPRVLADRERLVQVLTNLVSNALKYSPKGGAVTVAAEATDGRVRLSVADQGLGIPPDELPRLFSRFYRIEDSARRDIPGTGLGLFICRHLVELHGGRLWAESPGAGRGSTFFLELPASGRR